MSKNTISGLKDLIRIDVRGKVVTIELVCRGEIAKLVNMVISDRLDDLIEMEIVKYYKNRIDFFLIRPQDGWRPFELLVEIKKRLEI